MATIIEIGREQPAISLRQRWSHYFVLIYAALCVVIAINLRDSALNATIPYADVETGIRARYPANWLIDQAGDYVFRVQDVRHIGFKTAIVVDLQPVSLNTATRNLADALSLDRAQTLTGYRILDIDEAFTLPNGTPATALLYTYVDVAANPILQTLPTVVEGLDIIAIQQGQAIIVSFLADTQTFETDRVIFERFLDALEF